MHLNTATLPLMAFWSSTRTVQGSRKTEDKIEGFVKQVVIMHHIHFLGQPSKAPSKKVTWVVNSFVSINNKVLQDSLQITMK